MGTTKTFVACLLLSCLAGGCVSSPQDEPKTKPPQDAWLDVPQAGEFLQMNGERSLPDDCLFEVIPDHESESEKMLDSTAIEQIEWETAYRLAGRHFPGKEGHLRFLARGLYFSKGTGRWNLHESGERLQIVHDCMGDRTLETRRQALVILLRSRPTKVYVFCRATE